MLSVLPGNPLCLSSDSVSESKILGSELALALQLKGFGERKLLVSCLLDEFLGEFFGCMEWLMDKVDWGDTAGDIMRRRFTGFEGVRQLSWSYGECS